MSHPRPQSPASPVRSVLLINAVDNPIVGMEGETFQRPWRWIKTPKQWKPGDPLPEAEHRIEGIVVFSTKYKEDEVRQLCEQVRAMPNLSEVPLLVAVDQYEMPLANRVREMPNTDFIITPIEEGDLMEHFDRAARSKE